MWMSTKRLTSGARLLLSLSGLAGALGLLGAGAGLRAANADGLGPGAARAAYFAGKRAGDGRERRRWFAAGVSEARKRLEARGDDPEGLLWLAANLGAEALEHGKLHALGVLAEMERLLLKLEATAPEYDHAASARTLARLYHKAPALISIGSMKKARAYWEKALGRAGDYPPNLVLAADFFADDGDAARARTLARRYLASPVRAGDHPEAGEWLAIARERATTEGP
jgi:hypothetical protein